MDISIVKENNRLSGRFEQNLDNLTPMQYSIYACLPALR